MIPVTSCVSYSEQGGLFATAPAQLALQAGLRHVPAVAASLLVLTEASESSLGIHYLHAPTGTEYIKNCLWNKGGCQAAAAFLLARVNVNWYS